MSERCNQGAATDEVVRSQRAVKTSAREKSLMEERIFPAESLGSSDAHFHGFRTRPEGGRAKSAAVASASGVPHLVADYAKER